MGSFGEVWRARHHIFNELVAIKIPTDSQYVRHLQQEGMAIHGLAHANIVRAIDLDPYADPPYLIMEYVTEHRSSSTSSSNREGLPVDRPWR
jgi:serine/threonine protein kinase